MRSFLFLTIFLSALGANAQSKDLQQVYRELPEKFYTTMVHCPNKIWPDYDWKNVSILMLEKGLPAVVWDGSDNQVNFVEETQVPPEAYLGLYKFFDWQGTTGISLNPPPESNFLQNQRLFGLAVHEGFHKVGQKNWTKSQTARGTVIPYESRPRIYRRMMFTNLRAYLLDPQKNSEGLKKAAYWNNRWTSEFPEETAASTDGYEGTAEYVEELAKIYGEQGCDVSEQKVIEALIERVKNDPVYNPKSVQFQLDSEGYSFGSLSGFILTYLVGDLDWFEKVQQGESPVDVLLSSQKPLYEKINKTIQNEFEAAADRENKNVETMLGTFLKDFSDKRFIRIALVGKGASFSPKGFFLPKRLPNITVVPLGSNLQLNNQDQSVTVLANTVLFQTTDSPCDGSFFRAILPVRELQIEKDVIVLSSSGLNGKMKGRLKIDHEGFQWFCGEKQ